MVTRAFKNATNFEERTAVTPLVINGDMAIAQRGTSFTTTGSFPVDRFSVGYGVTGGTFTISQDSTSPADFNNSIKFLVGTGASAGSSEQAFISTSFEGNNTSHLNFGTSDAKTITLSFHVRSSLTGTFCVALINNAFDRSYIAEYTISSADTWEKKTITISGDTSGTWVGAVNTRSMLFRFDLGSGSNYNTTAGAWQSGSFRNTSSQTSLVNTSGATFYITGVQLEVGSFNTSSIPPFQFEDRTTSLARCQRYFTRLEAGTPYSQFGSGVCTTTTAALVTINLPTNMRTIGSFSDSGTFRIVDGGGSHVCTAVNADTNTRSDNLFRCDTTTSGLNDGNGCFLSASNDATAFMQMDAEL